MTKVSAKSHAPKKPIAKPNSKTSAANSGNGRDLHQFADGDATVLTTQQGIPVADDQNSLRQGQRCPALLEDFHLREKVFHFDHERIPERVVHTRG
jgi:catalase